MDEPLFDWAHFLLRKDAEIARLESIYERNLQSAGVETVADHAEIVEAHTVRLRDSGRVVSAGTILVATGGRPTVPQFPGNELAITSDEVFHLSERPQRVLIVGGGYIAV